MVLVMGNQKSGKAARELLIKEGFEVEVFDDSQDNVAEFLKKVGGFELLVLSPAISLLHPLVQMASSQNIPVISELELGYRFRNKSSKIVAISGTNGKTTTTALIGHILGESCYTAGNIGLPWSSVSGLKKTAVLEVSSFQLENIVEFLPDIAVLLNIAPDHLSRHGSMEEYKRMKYRLFENQNKEHYAVLSEELKNHKELKNIKSQQYYFGFSKQKNGCYLDGSNVVFSQNGKSEEVFSVNDSKLFGSHNTKNILAAVCVCRLLGVDSTTIKNQIHTFVPLRHRMELVGEFGGVLAINDSKSTNVHSCVSALECFEKNVVLMLGGSSKGEEFDDIFKHKSKIKKIIVCGETSKQILYAAKRNNYFECAVASSPDQWIEIAMSEVKEGDILLFSPACASFDFFKNYEERGDFFVEKVRSIFNIHLKDDN